jgi:hypothetical protein
MKAWSSRQKKLSQNITSRHKRFFYALKVEVGANGITQATPACFLIAFVTIFLEIFLEYSQNILGKIFKNMLFY